MWGISILADYRPIRPFIEICPRTLCSVYITLPFFKNAPPWNSGEPNNHGSNEDCVSMYKERPIWNDIPCSSYRIYSICEFIPN